MRGSHRFFTAFLAAIHHPLAAVAMTLIYVWYSCISSLSEGDMRKYRFVRGVRADTKNNRGKDRTCVALITNISSKVNKYIVTVDYIVTKEQRQQTTTQQQQQGIIVTCSL